MKTSIHVFAFTAALLGVSAVAGAAGLGPTDQFGTRHVVFRGDVITQAPRPHSLGAETLATAQSLVQARQPQAPSSYALHSLLARAPVKPEVARAQGE